MQGAAFLHCGSWTSRVLSLSEQNVFDGPARVPPMVVLGFFSEILLSPTLVSIPLQVALFLLRGPGTSRVLGLLGQTVSGGPARVTFYGRLGFLI